MEPLHICHISMLNPAQHTRIFHKLARSQQGLGYRVSIIAQDPANSPYTTEGIDIFPLRPFKRLSPQRIWAQVRIARQAFSLDADLYVIHSPELIPLAFRLIRKGKKVLYDVHEDYALTISSGKHYPALIRKTLARAVRIMEKRLAEKAAGVVYAEQCYENILEVPEEKYLVLGNKYQSNTSAQKPQQTLPAEPFMLFTGTLAPEWGIWETLDLWERMQAAHPIPLVVAGYSQYLDLVKTLKMRIANHKNAYLIGGDSYVPYGEIVYLLERCSFASGLYQLSPFVRNKIPTKFYEAMAFGKPILFSQDPYWEALNETWRFGISYTPEMPIKELLHALETWSSNYDQSVYSWEAEAQKLATFLQRL